MPNIAVRILLLAFTILSVPVPALAETSKEIQSSIRNAWETRDCGLAQTIMEEMRNHSSLSVYYFYQAESFEFGHCAERNIDKAIAAYKKSYDLSHTLGVMQIGILYLNDKKGPETAQKWFRLMAVLHGPEEREKVKTDNQHRVSEALKQAFIRATIEKRKFPNKEFAQALSWITELERSKTGEELYKYALIFENGEDGYPIHHHASFKLLIKAVELDYPPAAWHWAKQLLKEVDEGKRSLYHPLGALKVAAYGGIVDAQVQVGRIYRSINKKPRHLERAYEWFIYARKNGAHIDDEIKQILQRIDHIKAEKMRNSIEQNGKMPN